MIKIPFLCSKSISFLFFFTKIRVASRSKGDYSHNSIWKAVEIAMASTPPRYMPIRPTMGHVVMELECLGTVVVSVQAEIDGLALFHLLPYSNTLPPSSNQLRESSFCK